MNDADKVCVVRTLTFLKDEYGFTHELTTARHEWRLVFIEPTTLVNPKVEFYCVHCRARVRDNYDPV